MAYTVTVRSGDKTRLLSAEGGTRLSDVLRDAGFTAVFPCGGRGVCGRCRVQASGALAPAGKQERALLGAALDTGIRLACLTQVTGDCTVVLPDSDIEVVAGASVLPDFTRDPIYKSCGAAVDIGTTTLAAQLWQGDAPIAQRTALNPQSAFGADVISRIEAALHGELPALRRAVVDAVGTLLTEMCDETGMLPEAVVVTGNTTMLHLFAGADPEPLSHAPFAARRLFGEFVSGAALGLPERFSDCRIYLAPCFSAFVGGDIATAVLASGMLERQETALLVDIGTNGEMALCRDGKLLCCSTAAGPVFEGAQISCGMQGRPGAIDTVHAENGELRCTTIGGAKAIGVCGSGLVDAVNALLELEQLDSSGALDCEGVELAAGVTLTGRDIRMVQLAKGAIRAGMETLCNTEGIEIDEIRTLYIAGGFGARLNVSSAAGIGMIPPVLAPRARVIGNAALAGASMLLRAAPLADSCRDFIAASRTVELSANPLFSDNYMEAMLF